MFGKAVTELCRFRSALLTTKNGKGAADGPLYQYHHHARERAVEELRAKYTAIVEARGAVVTDLQRTELVRELNVRLLCSLYAVCTDWKHDA